MSNLDIIKALIETYHDLDLYGACTCDMVNCQCNAKSDTILKIINEHQMKLLQKLCLSFEIYLHEIEDIGTDNFKINAAMKRIEEGLKK